MSTTPATPQWAIEAIIACDEWSDITQPLWHKKKRAAIIAKHAPPLSPPTDEAKLREKIVEILQHYNPTIRTGYGDATRRIMDLFAPHLSQREPGDSELLSQNEQDEDAFNNWNRDITGYQPSLFEAYQFGLNRGRAAIKSAQRGEGKPL